MVQFEGDSLLAVVLEGEGVVVPVRTICLAIGLDVQSQSERLRDHDVLSRGLRIVKVPIDGRIRSVVAILHEYIPFFLATITPRLVAEDVRPKLVRYQLELKDLLSAVYSTAVGPSTSGERDSLASLQQQIRAMLHEVRLLRAQTLDMHTATTEQFDVHDLRITTIEGVLDERLSDLTRQIEQQHLRMVEQETLIAEHTLITSSQVAAIKQMVNAIAQRYKKRHGQEVFGKVYGEFSFAMGIPSYDRLPAGKYADAVAWLRTKAEELGVPDALPGTQESLL
jgi:hypothetical protein